jgi:hypothetical protein
VTPRPPRGAIEAGGEHMRRPFRTEENMLIGSGGTPQRRRPRIERTPHRRRPRLTGRNSVTRTREYYYSLYTVVAVKIVLFSFLCVFFGASIRIMRTSFKNIAQLWRVALPTAVAIIALIVAYQIFKNIKEIVRYDRELKESRKMGPPPKTG